MSDGTGIVCHVCGHEFQYGDRVRQVDHYVGCETIYDGDNMRVTQSIIEHRPRCSKCAEPLGKE